MREDPDQTLILCTLAGGLAVAAGAMTAFVLPHGLCVTLGLFLLIRICWLHDNMVNDLSDKDRLPASYAAAFARRQRLCGVLFGTLARTTPPSAARLATRLRAEAGFWAAFLLAGAAVLMAQALPFGPVPSALLALWLFLWALRRADRLTETLRRLEAGQTDTMAPQGGAPRPDARR